jgi:AbrB family looped-hinge helix DNA binding protein
VSVVALWASYAFGKILTAFSKKVAAMKITSKGQVTIPQAVREQAGLLPHSEVEFEVLANGDVVIRAIATPQASIRQRFARVRGTANASQFKDMGTDEFMAFLRG